jgi:tetratricopeptide (TPR) repeat protein
MQTTAELLADYRVRNVRASEEIVEKGRKLLENNGVRKLGDEGWALLEQVALAAMDIGQMELADDLLAQLEEKFPDSPRVQCLHGIRLETTGDLKGALQAYDEVLEGDESNAAIWKRKVSVLRQLGDTKHALEELLRYLDVFYADVEGWLEAADIYATCNLYPQSLSALSHVMLLAPQNSYYVLQAAETAYTAGDVPLATKMFLRTLEMADDGGPSRRAWYGVKLCARRFLQTPNLPSASETDFPEHVELLDQLATEKILASNASSKSKNGATEHCREAVVRWLEKH